MLTVPIVPQPSWLTIGEGNSTSLYKETKFLTVYLDWNRVTCGMDRQTSMWSFIMFMKLSVIIRMSSLVSCLFSIVPFFFPYCLPYTPSSKLTQSSLHHHHHQPGVEPHILVGVCIPHMSAIMRNIWLCYLLNSNLQRSSWWMDIETTQGMTIPSNLNEPRVINVTGCKQSETKIEREVE